MTEDERRNRNPAPEWGRVNLTDHPEVRAHELELNRVYLLHRGDMGMTMNYAGKMQLMNKRTLETVMAHCFYGPRNLSSIALMAEADGTLHDDSGKKVTVRRYTGPDA